jgi:hypothetical protein
MSMMQLGQAVPVNGLVPVMVGALGSYAYG